jgi:sialate O-acetylesterase
MRHILCFSLILLSVTVLIHAADDELTPAYLFNDHAVLQRNQKIPVWGTASPDAIVTASINGNTVSTTSNANGDWRVLLPEMKAGGPYELTIASGKKYLTFTDILIGDVWVCSGQSNMAMSVQNCQNAEDEIAAANYPNIRLLTARIVTSFTPEVMLPGAAWRKCSPETIPSFSAVGYFFGRECHKKSSVSIGLISASCGGTLAEAWTNHEALERVPELKPILERGKNDKSVLTDPEEILMQKEAVKQRRILWKEMIKAEDNMELADATAQPSFDDIAWKTMLLPNQWEKAGLPNFDGMVWFRKTIILPPEWVGKEVILNLGPIDDLDVTWFNGVQVGMRGSFQKQINQFWNVPRHYSVSANLVKAGKCVIAVRVIDANGAGGLWGGNAAEMSLSLANDKDEAIPLAGEWRYWPQLELPEVKFPSSHNLPSVLYNGTINPLLPYAICGAIWYQGESNGNRGYQYRLLFPALIKGWREKWGCDFPFYFVQLPNHYSWQAKPVEHAWAELREAQAMALSLPRTGMACTIDVGDAKDIHPQNKQDVGLRLAQWALKNEYGFEDTVVSGPIYKSMEIEGNIIRIYFTHVAGGLTVKGSLSESFAIAGNDKKFFWAQAKIEGDNVVVFAEEVKEPVAVRYGWAGNPKSSLYNTGNLPTVPFRTDDWPVSTSNNK